MIFFPFPKLPTLPPCSASSVFFTFSTGKSTHVSGTFSLSYFKLWASHFPTPFQIQARHGQAHGQSWYFSPAVLTTSHSCPLLAMDTSITPNYLILPPWACSASPTAPCKAIKSPWVTLMMLTEHKLALTSFPSLTPSVNITANPFAYSFSNEHSNSPVSPSLPLST